MSNCKLVPVAMGDEVVLAPLPSVEFVPSVKLDDLVSLLPAPPAQPGTWTCTAPLYFARCCGEWLPGNTYECPNHQDHPNVKPASGA